MNIQWKSLFNYCWIIVAVLVAILCLGMFGKTIYFISTDELDSAKQCLEVLQKCSPFWVGFYSGLAYNVFKDER